MTNTELLEKLIEESGLKKKYIAEKMNLSYYGLLLKIQNKNDFTAPEIDRLCHILKIKKLSLKEKVFFAHKDDK